MSLLHIPDQKKTIQDRQVIQSFLNKHCIRFEAWKANKDLSNDVTQAEIIAAYSQDIDRLKQEEGYLSCDVISVNENTPNIEAIRNKFLPEHTHTDDEVRYFVSGSGLFWFNLDDAPTFYVKCVAGDLISVPADTKHWFDFGPSANVKCIRLFNDESGWVANYTESGVDKKYNPAYSA